MAAKDTELPVRESSGSTAYEDGAKRLSAAVETAVKDEWEWESRLSAGLRGGLAFLAADPALAHLLLVESLAAARPARLEHERMLARLAQALRPPPGAIAGGETISEETACLLAGGLVSHLTGRVLAGEAERLPESHEPLLRYLLAPLSPAASRAGGRRAAHG